MTRTSSRTCVNFLNERLTACFQMLLLWLFTFTSTSPSSEMKNKGCSTFWSEIFPPFQIEEVFERLPGFKTVFVVEFRCSWFWLPVDPARVDLWALWESDMLCFCSQASEGPGQVSYPSAPPPPIHAVAVNKSLASQTTVNKLWSEISCQGITDQRSASWDPLYSPEMNRGVK